MSLPRLNRRKFLTVTLLGVPALAVGAAAADARLIEPTWLKIRRVAIGTGPGTHRLAHFSDVHHKGDSDYLRAVVAQINALQPDFVCFTGDLIEDKEFLAEALKILSGLQAPLFGVPGNHDYWSRAPFAPIFKAFAATGGAWLMDQSRLVAGGKINLIGASCRFGNVARWPLQPQAKNILLMHYPSWVEKLGDQKFDLMLAGHSHGGQVRLPFFGPLVVPYNVERYDMGLFQTPNGPLYVNPGIGYLGHFNIRFNCRPEITVMEV